MKRLFFISFLLFCIQGNGQPSEKKHVKEVKTFNDSCLNAVLTIKKFGQRVGAMASNVECFDDYHINIYLNRSSCVKTSSGCSETIQLWLNNTLLRSNLSVNSVVEFDSQMDSSIYSSMDLSSYKDMTEVNFTVKRIVSCNQSDIVVESVLLPFQVGSYHQFLQSYEVSYLDWRATNIDLVPCDWRLPQLWGTNQSVKVDVCEKNDKKTSVTTALGCRYDVSLGVKGSVGNKKFEDMIGVNASASGSYEVSQSVAHELLLRVDECSSYTITPSNCKKKVVGFAIEKVPYRKATYYLKCGEPDQLIEDSEVIYWIPNRYMIYDHCELPMDSEDCSLFQDEPTIDKGENELDPTGKCEYYIKLSFDYEDEFNIVWSGPEGYTADGLELNNLDVGRYHYTIVNNCCEMIEGDVDVCDDLVISNWVKFENEWCREFSCIDSEKINNPSFQNCIKTECVVPDSIINGYNKQGDCIKKHYFKGELLGELMY